MNSNSIDEKPALKVGDKLPSGCVVYKNSSGGLSYRQVFSWSTETLREGCTYVESVEEACALTGELFTPYAPYCFSKATLDEIQKREKRIIYCASKIDKSFWSIAFDLHWMNEKKAWASKSCGDIVSYSEKMFGYGKTTCYSLIAVVDRFAKRDKDGSIIEAPDDLAKDYSVSKLELMVNLTDDQIKQLKPSMSVREIKKFIKGLEEKPAPVLPDNSTGNEDIKEPEEPPNDSTEDNIVDSTAEVINRSVLVSYNGSADYEKKKSKIDSSISRILKKHPDALIEVSYTLP